jgi:hypothetical protein
MSSRRSRHRVLQGWPQGVWCPAAVGLVRGYPKTLETFKRQCEQLRANHKRAKEKGLLTRDGVPNGWAGRRDDIAVERRNAQTAAEMLTDTWETLMEGISEGLCPMSKRALTVVAEIALSPLNPPRMRLQALRLFLDFTVPKLVRQELMQTDDPLGLLRRLADRAVRRKEQ